MPKNKKVRAAVHQELLLSGKYHQRIVADKTKYNRKPKHRHINQGGDVLGIYDLLRQLSK